MFKLKHSDIFSWLMCNLLLNLVYVQYAHAKINSLGKAESKSFLTDMSGQVVFFFPQLQTVCHHLKAAQTSTAKFIFDRNTQTENICVSSDDLISPQHEHLFFKEKGYIRKSCRLSPV